ncbi:acetate--CoA ligase family protein [Thermodesulfobacteriota bacterium]
MSRQEHTVLDRLFYPKNVAMVGASPKKGIGMTAWSSGNAYIAGCINQGFQGNIFPVHPSGENILGFKTYRSVREIPVEIDLAIFTVPSRVALHIMEECAEKSVKFVHLLTAGFGETGLEEDEALEKELIQVARKGGIRVIGPNCMGVLCPEGGLAWAQYLPNSAGKISFFFQSGALAEHVLIKGSFQGLRYGKAVSFGNARDLQPHDFLNYFAHDQKTEIIASYLEGLRDGRTFFNTARATTPNKPLVVWKGGRTEGGSRATRSHTAAIAGSREIWEGLCRQAGIISVNSVEEMICSLSALQKLPLPRGTNVAIVGGDGGESVTMTDIAEEEGLKVPHLSEETIGSLKEFVPRQGTSVRNPLDVLPYLFDFGDFQRTLRLLDDDTRIDAIILNIPTWYFYTTMGRRVFNEFLQVAIETNKTLKKPMLIVVEKEQDLELHSVRKETVELFHEGNCATFPFIQLAARILAKLNEYRQYLGRNAETVS